MKTCTLCGVEKPASDFEPQRRQCLCCRKKRMKVTRAEYYAKNRAQALVAAQQWRQENQDRKKATRKAEYERSALFAREATRKYRQDNPAKVNAWSRKHQLAKRKRTPAWLSPDDHWVIEQAYELAQLRTKIFGFEWQVDHKIPLQGRLVSGLHVPHNLQVIPAKINRSKSNQYAVT
jgi:hypothetical protein